MAPVIASQPFHAPAIVTRAYFEPGTTFNDEEAGNLERDLVGLPDSPSGEVYFVNRAVRPFDDGDPHAAREYILASSQSAANAISRAIVNLCEQEWRSCSDDRRGIIHTPFNRDLVCSMC